MTEYEHLLIEQPADGVRRIVLNRPEKRNAISTPMRTEILEALQEHDRNEEVRVTIISGAGQCFSSGYDLTSGGLMENPPIYSPPGDGQWTRQATDSWFRIWDLA